MRPFRTLLIFLVVVFLGGALLGPALYMLAHTVAPYSWLAQHPFHRYMNRAFLGLALICIWPLLRSLRATSWGEVGLKANNGSTRFFAYRGFVTGFVVGANSLLFVSGLALVEHQIKFNTQLSAGHVMGGLAAALAAGLIVGFLEELLFRGALFGGFRRVWDWRLALIFSSVIFSLLHFMGKVHVEGPVTWLSGFQFLLQMWQVSLPDVLNLFLIGVLLGLIYQGTGNLYVCIGLHAGWVFWIKCYGLLTLPMTTTNHSFWGTEKMYDGWVVTVALGIMLVIVLGLHRTRPPRTST